MIGIDRRLLQNVDWPLIGTGLAFAALSGITLSSRDAMVPGTPFDGTVSITVRVDKDGDPITRRKGDVFGQASGIKVGAQDVKVSLDTVQKEDVTLSGPTGGAMPAGHGMPPGHP